MNCEAPPDSRLQATRGLHATASFWKAGLIAVAAALVAFGTPALGLASGIAFALLSNRRVFPWQTAAGRWLLQGLVVLLGFSLDLHALFEVGLRGAWFTALLITVTLLLGRWLGRRSGLSKNTATLVSAGTAICGGSAIAAVSTVLDADDREVAVAIGAVFIFNGAALYVFPAIGHALNMPDVDFGTWSGLAIHDISSVVGAGLAYGPEALVAALAVKLARTLWIVPVSLVLAWTERASRADAGSFRRLPVPWLVVAFLLAASARTLWPSLANWVPVMMEISQHVVVVVLFLIGTSLSRGIFVSLGWRVLVVAGILWITTSAISLVAILQFGLRV